MQPGLFALGIAMHNIPQYSMEIRFVVVGSLKITAGGKDGDFDIGPVEIEMIFTTMFLLAAIFGTQDITKPLATQYESLDFLPDWVSKSSCICIFFFLIIIFFMVDNLKDAIAKDVKTTIKMALGPLIVFAQAAFAVWLGVETFKV